MTVETVSEKKEMNYDLKGNTHFSTYLLTQHPAQGKGCAGLDGPAARFEAVWAGFSPSGRPHVCMLKGHI